MREGRPIATDKPTVTTAIVEHSAEAIVALDGHDLITEFNPAAERLFGWPRPAVVGRPAHVLVPERLRARAQAWCRQARLGESVIGCDALGLHRDGRAIALEMSLTRLGPPGPAAACSATFRARTPRPDAGRAKPAPRPFDSELAGGIVELARRELGMQVALLSEVSEDRQIFRAVAGESEAIDAREGSAAALSDTICARMLAGTIPRVVPDTRAEPGLSDITGVRSYVGVPVHRPDGTLYGTLCGASSVPDTTLGERELTVLEALAGVLTEHARRSRVDPVDRRMKSELAALLGGVDTRDGYTAEHSRAVVELAARVAEALGLDERDTETVTAVALLHDIGKIAVPATILGKRGALTGDEWQLMREHAATGSRLTAAIGALGHLAGPVRATHERWDGQGYPDGLAGEEIPLAARIAGVCDAYQAMISDRPYRAAFSREQAITELCAGSGSVFDPAVVEALLAVLFS